MRNTARPPRAKPGTLAILVTLAAWTGMADAGPMYAAEAATHSVAPHHESRPLHASTQPVRHVRYYRPSYRHGHVRGYHRGSVHRGYKRGYSRGYVRSSRGRVVVRRGVRTRGGFRSHRGRIVRR